MTKIFIFDAQTNEEITRDMTADELAEANASKVESDANFKAHSDAKTALLSKLGITTEEAALLLG